MTKWILCLCIALATSMASIAAAQTTRPGGGNAPMDTTRTVFLRLRITPTTVIVFNNLHNWIETFTQTEVQKLGGRKDSVQVSIMRSVTRSGVNELVADVFLSVPKDTSKEGAKKLVDQVMREVERQLEQSRKERIKNRDELTAKIKALDAFIQDKQETLRKTNVRVDLPPDAFKVTRVKLDQEAQSLTLDLVGMEARREALQRAIAEQSKVAVDRVQKDPIASELQTVVKIRTQQAEQLKAQHAAGMAPNSELSAVAVALVEARAKLLERQELVESRAGGEMLGAWNRELLNLSIDRAEKTAKANYINRQLEAFHMLQDIQLNQNERDSLQRDLTQVQEELKIEPTVKVDAVDVGQLRD